MNVSDPDRPYTILLTGSKTALGCSIVKALLTLRQERRRLGSIGVSEAERDLVIRALVRNPHSASSRVLAGRGVELHQGNLYHRVSLQRAFAGCDSVLLQTFDTGNTSAGASSEVRQGVTAIDVAESLGVPHMMYLSTRSAAPSPSLSPASAPVTGAVRTFPPPAGTAARAKYEIEEYLLACRGITHTIARLAIPMEIFSASFYRPLLLTALHAIATAHSLEWFAPASSQRQLELISTHDAAAAIAAIATHTERFENRTLTLVADRIPLAQLPRGIPLPSSLATAFLPRYLAEITRVSVAIHTHTHTPFLALPG